MAEVAGYESDSEPDDVAKAVPTRNLPKPIKTIWAKEFTFATYDESMKFIEAEKSWGYSTSSQSEEGKKIYYRCNKVKARGVQCLAKLYLLFDSTSTDIILFRATHSHTHNDIDTKANTGLPDEVKVVIKELWLLKIKPKAILENLNNRQQLPKPSMRQVTNYLSVLNSQKFGRSSISLGEIEAWCEEKSIIPENEDEGFIVNYEIDTKEEDNPLFRFYVSTKRLLNLATFSTKLHADATYKLVWQGFPVLVCGTTDLGRHFHHFGISVCVNEKQEDFEFVFKTIKDSVKTIFNKEVEFDVMISDAAGK